jgi:GT2 family glycosyltransferase
MSNSAPTVSIVLLSYNRPELLREALDSLVAQSYPPFEIIVIDNCSPKSAQAARVVEQYPRVKLIKSVVNLGYAGGMNLGIKEVTGQYTYLTEDDIVLDKDCVKQLTDYMEANQATAIASPVMYNQTAGTIRCAGGEVALGGIYLRKTYNETNRGADKFPKQFDVSFLDGAALFTRTDFLQSTGGFREEFFMYGEAVEFCVRVGKTGKKMTVVPDAKVYHVEPPENANISPEFAFHRYKNLFSLYLLHAPARCLPEFLARYVALGGLRAILGRGGNIRMLLKALFWILKRTPALLKERRGDRRPAREIAATFAPEIKPQRLSSR